MNLEPLRARLAGTPLAALEPLVSDDFIDSIRHGDMLRWRQLLAALPFVQPSEISLNPEIRIGKASDCSPVLLRKIESSLRELIPWRKGPFDVFGIHIDSEWRSELKWQRLEHHIAPLRGKKVLDLGCGNGYYCLRMSGLGADLVLGIDQHIPYVAQFWLLKRFLPGLQAYVLPLSVDQLPDKLGYFDSVFSMGVIYHSRAPVEHLLKIHASLVPGGELILETMIVDGACGYALTPEDRYARMNNVWFVPSIATLERWLLRSGFINVRVVDQSTTADTEQRKTEWMPYDSLVDALDPNDPSVTIEGLPAPQRVILLCNKPQGSKASQ
ncbi:MAG: tRNA 5-methoxyuridine(34)/uridine 5-oxyacetic acid(34) synthase CmoB [Gammaproteobacteria bacterium]